MSGHVLLIGIDNCEVEMITSRGYIFKIGMEVRKMLKFNTNHHNCIMIPCQTGLYFSMNK